MALVNCFSWFYYDDNRNVMYKKCDKSFFEYHGSAIPIQIREFFNAELLENGKKIEIELCFQNKLYNAYIDKGSNNSYRTRIFWRGELVNILKEHKKRFIDYPIFKFEKLNITELDKYNLVYNGKQIYIVSFVLNDDEQSIDFYNEVIQDNVLINELRSDSLEHVNDNFVYSLKPKKKKDSIVLNKHKTYPRDKMVSKNALIHAKFKCEVNKNHLTFIRRNSDKPYTEPHHLIPMAYSDKFDVSLDVEENIVSLCSNCHNEIHYGRDANRLIEKLYNERKNLLKKVGIEIELEDLLQMY